MLAEERVHLSLPLSAHAIQQAITAFKQQFKSECYLYVKGHVILSTGERCLAPGWLPVVRPDRELDLLGIGDPEVCDADEMLTWVAATHTTILLLSTSRLDSPS